MGVEVAAEVCTGDNTIFGVDCEDAIASGCKASVDKEDAFFAGGFLFTNGDPSRVPVRLRSQASASSRSCCRRTLAKRALDSTSCHCSSALSLVTGCDCDALSLLGGDAWPEAYVCEYPEQNLEESSQCQVPGLKNCGKIVATLVSKMSRHSQMSACPSQSAHYPFVPRFGVPPLRSEDPPQHHFAQQH